MVTKKSIGFVFDQEFKEQVEFFKNKVNMPTEKYTDLLGSGHSKSFVIAGATKEAILCDFFQEIQTAQIKGTGLKEFKASFDAIVKKHGWKHKGSAGWRAKVIFETNMRTSYQAGRYKQMTDPTVLALRPFWEYRHGGSKNPRQEHLNWSGLVLPADSPWWNTHYPPNGWGCSCYVVTRSARDLKRLNKTVDKAPKLDLQDKIVGKGDEAISLKVPKGIDAGWDYNPGQAAYGNMDRAKPLKKGGANWKPEAPKETHKTLEIDDKPFIKRRKLKTTPKVKTTKEAVETIEKEYGKSPIFKLAVDEFEYGVSLDAGYLARHIVEDKSDPTRLDYIPLLKECIEDPQEVWSRFETNATSGKVRLVFNFLKNFELEKDGKIDRKTVFVAANAINGKISISTMFPTNDNKYIDGKRSGKLILSKN